MVKCFICHSNTWYITHMVKYFKQHIISIRFARCKNLWCPCLLPACYQTNVLLSHNYSLNWYLSNSLYKQMRMVDFVPFCHASKSTVEQFLPPLPQLFHLLRQPWSPVLPVEKYEGSVARAFNWWYSFQLSLGVLSFCCSSSVLQRTVGWSLCEHYELCQLITCQCTIG